MREQRFTNTDGSNRTGQVEQLPDAEMKAIQLKKNIKTLLVLQLAYLAFGLGYNVVSYVLMQSTGTGLAQTSPVFGFLAVALIPGLCTVIGWIGRMKIHAIYALFVSFVFCLVGGTLPHVRAFIAGDLSKYLSVTSLFAAASINFTGAIIYLVSAWTAWKMRNATDSQVRT